MSDTTGTDLVYTDNMDGATAVRLTDATVAKCMDRLTVHSSTSPYDDARWHGRININTASRAVLMSLPFMGPFPGNGRMLADSIIRGRPYYDFEDLVIHLDGAASKASNDSRDNDADGVADDVDEQNGDLDYLDGNSINDDRDCLTDETDEGIEYFLTRIANVATLRSDVFEVIVRAEVVDRQKNTVIGSAQLRAIVDRSTVTTTNGPKILSRRWE